MNRIATAGRLARFFSTFLLCLGPLHAVQTYFGVFTGFAAPTQLVETLSRVSDAKMQVHEIGVTPQSEWVIVAGKSVFSSPGFPAFTLEKIKQFVGIGRTIDVVSFAPNGSWVVIAEDLYWRSAGLPQSALLAEQIEVCPRHLLMDLYQRKAMHKEALAEGERALSVSRRLMALDPAIQNRRAYARTLTRLTKLHAAAGNPEEML
ncbi:MAG: hypothetical protein HXY18_03035 [Bryobacteraceae bacterium]|nr:hypothetical protein [Bryobacteraceae bacterium]